MTELLLLYLDWEHGETLCVDGEHDKVVLLSIELNGKTFTAEGVISCGELVEVNDVETEINKN